MKLKVKQEKGITLIALIVTIIVLLILSAISIAMLTGQNGILGQAAKASELTSEAQLDEKVKLAIMEARVNGLGKIESTELLDNALNNSVGEGRYILTETDNGWNIKTVKEDYVLDKDGNVTIVDNGQGGGDDNNGDTKLPETAEGQTAGTAIKNPESYGVNPNAQATADGEGKYFALPKGATYVEGTVDTGVVINIDDNEFVWVPVPEAIFDNSNASELPLDSSAGTDRGNDYTPMAIETSTGNYSGILYDYWKGVAYLKYPTANNYQGTSQKNTEPDIVSKYDGGDKDTVPEKITKGGLQNDYNEMVTKVVQYGGFYVGRYEMGIQNGKIVSKNANTIEGVVTADDGQDETKSWYGLYQAGKHFETDTKVTSSMVWGSQYDAMMNWMAKGGQPVGTENNDKRNSTKVTGRSEKDVINNVYDLYGCHLEWTLEAYCSGVRYPKGEGRVLWPI